MQPNRPKFLVLAIIAALAALLSAPSLALADDVSQLAAGSLADTGTIAAPAQASVSYSVHTLGGDWQEQASNGTEAASGGSIDALTLKLSVDPAAAGSIQYQVYTAGKGWQAVKSNGSEIGKPGLSITALRVALDGELSKRYDVSYAVKTADDETWQESRTNGAVAGKADKGMPLTAIKVQLVEKTKAAGESDGLVGVRYRARTGKNSWQVWQINNAKAGKTGNKSRMYGLAIALDKGSYTGDILYRVRLNNGKWKAWRKNGALTGKNANIEAVEIKLEGEIAEKYDVVYRVNVKGVSWQKRVRNGETAGTTGRGLQIRAIRIQLVEKTKRSGWIGSDSSWEFYKDGAPVKSQWVTTKESPIDEMQGSSDKALRYWIDATGKLAVDRIIDPNAELDAGAGFMAYALKYGYIMTNDSKTIGGVWYIADADGVLTKSPVSKKKRIEQYVTWAIGIANDNSHGYSQKNRWGPDYDCSSLVVSALVKNGFQVGFAVWTGNMKAELTKYGFKWCTDFSKLKRGDILLVHSKTRQHTEIYIGKGKTVGAHIAETGGVYGVAGDQTGNEISVGPYYSIWQGYLRYTG